MPALRDFTTLSFDCYGTLIDWETGIWDALQPLLMENDGAEIARETLLQAFGEEEHGQELSTPVILTGLVPEAASRLVTLSVMMLAGMLFGALWGLVPGWLRARLQVNEIITTLMMNYIAIAFVNFFVFGVWSEGGFQMTATFQRAAWFPRLSDYAEQWPGLRGLTTHFGLVVGLIASAVVWFLMYRSRWGYEIRLVGDNPRAAEYAGVNITRNTILVMMVSGALAGLAGMSEISGVVHRLQTAISPGYGFTGIIIAWLAKLNPIMVVPVSVLFGGLILAGREIQPAGVPRLIQGIILFMLIASEVLLRYRVRLARVGAGS